MPKYKLLSLPADFNPKYCSLDEACAYARHGRWRGHQKVREGRWKTFKDGDRRIVIFASVVADTERLIAESAGKPIEPVVKRRVGRPKRPKTEAPAHAALR